MNLIITMVVIIFERNLAHNWVLS